MSTMVILSRYMYVVNLADCLFSTRYLILLQCTLYLLMKHYVHSTLSIILRHCLSFFCLKLALTWGFDLYCLLNFYIFFGMLVNSLKPYRCIAFSLSNTTYISFCRFPFIGQACLWACTHTHTHIYTHRYIYIQVYFN